MREGGKPTFFARLKEGLRLRPRRYIFAFAMLLLILAAGLYFLFFEEDGYRSYMAKAAAAYQEEDYDSALSSLRKAEKIRAEDECLMLMADCYEAQGNWDKALETLRRMDLNDKAVSARIAALEQRRMQQQEADRLSVAGRLVPQDVTSLVLDDMGITDVILPELRQLRMLDSLSLRDNEITDLTPLAEMGGLSSLDLSGNRIENLEPLKKLTGLRILSLDNNPVTDLSPLVSLPNLASLSLRGIPVSGEVLAALAENLPGCAIHSDAEDGDVSDITLGGVTFKSDVTVLDLSGLGIYDLSALAQCRELKHLVLRDNAVADLQPLMNLPALEKLDLSNNAVSDLRPLIGLGSLRNLNASGNQISDTSAVGAMSGLTSLDLSGNPITDFSGLKKLNNLQRLSLKDTGVEDADLKIFEDMPSLTSLSLENNPGISDEFMGFLRSALPDCSISHSELVYLVDFGGAVVRSDVTELDMSSLGISDLKGLERFTALETVRLDHNTLSDLYFFKHCASRESIRSVSLADNQITDLSPLVNLTALEDLDLSGNQIENLRPLAQLSTLQSLNLSGNPVSEEELVALHEALPDCKIIR